MNDDIKKPEGQVSTEPAELTQAELDKVAGGSIIDILQAVNFQVNCRINDRPCTTSDPPAATEGAETVEK